MSMNFPLLRSRWCMLDKQQMKYVSTIAYIVQDLQHFPRGMTKVLDHLYLGNWQDATDVEKLREEGENSLMNFFKW